MASAAMAAKRVLYLGDSMSMEHSAPRWMHGCDKEEWKFKRQ